MKKPFKISTYSAREEFLNIATHAAGLFLSLIGSVLLIYKAHQLGAENYFLSSSIFGAALVLLYTASTLYHSARKPRLRFRLKIFDHIAIFLLIAGTYTPFAMITLKGDTGRLIFWIVWGIAGLGTFLKLFFTGKFKILSTLLYVGMGWIVIFAFKPLVENLSSEGINWLIAGGLSYTIGAIVYSLKSIKYNHAIFHVFVLIGSFCHYISIYNYVIV